MCQQHLAFFEQENLLPVRQLVCCKYYLTETPVLKNCLWCSDCCRSWWSHTSRLARSIHHFLYGGPGYSFWTSSCIIWFPRIYPRMYQLVCSQSNTNGCLQCAEVDLFSIGLWRFSRKCDWTIHFLLYTANVTAIADGLGTHSYADDTQLYAHFKPASCHDWLACMALCIEEIEKWMTSNRLKLNTDKTVHLAWQQTATGHRSMSSYYRRYLDISIINGSHVPRSTSWQWCELRATLIKRLVWMLLLPPSVFCTNQRTITVDTAKK